MSTCLVLLTKRYPYGSGEEFIEQEINYLANRFDSIKIVASGVYAHDTITRAVPENTEVRKITILKRRKLRYFQYCIRGAIGFLNKSLRDEKQKCCGIKQRLAAVYVNSRAKHIARNALSFEFEKTKKVVVYSYWLSDTALAAAIVKEQLRARGLEVTAVSRGHGYDLYDERNGAGVSPFRRFYLQKLDGVFPCSQDGQKYLCDKYPKEKEKISVRYLGVENEGTWSNTSRTDDVFRIVTCGNIVLLKNMMLVAEALSIIDSTTHASIEWYCIGDGVQANELHEFVKNTLKSVKVRFFGRLTNCAVHEVYRKNHLNLFVNVSKSEGLPVSIMEAMSYGIPAIATDVGGSREIVNDTNGSLVNANISKEGLARLMLDYYEMDDQRAANYRLNARRTWENAFCASRNYAQFADELVRLANHE